MTITSVLSDFSQLHAFSTVLQTCVVANRISGVFAKKNVEAYVVFSPKKNSKTIHWEGAVTWGEAGFTFDAKAAKSSVVYTYKKPLPYGMKSTEAEKFINDFISQKALPTLRDKVLHKKRGGRSTGYPILQARKFSTKPSATSDRRVSQYKKSGDFDSNFADFILAHHDQGIRCVGQ